MERKKAADAAELERNKAAEAARIVDLGRAAARHPPESDAVSGKSIDPEDLGKEFVDAQHNVCEQFEVVDPEQVLHEDDIILDRHDVFRRFEAMERKRQRARSSAR